MRRKASHIAMFFTLLFAIAVLAAASFIRATTSFPPPDQRLRTELHESSKRINLPSDLLSRLFQPSTASSYTAKGPIFQNPRADAFHVNSSKLLLVPFPIQDTRAGELPVSVNLTDDRQLFFWYWPSSNKRGSDDLTIWLNGVSLHILWICVCPLMVFCVEGARVLLFGRILQGYNLHSDFAHLSDPFFLGERTYPIRHIRQLDPQSLLMDNGE